MKKYYIIAAAIILVLVLGFYGCLALIKNATEEEVARVKSPSGKIEAVLIEENYGATVSFTNRADRRYRRSKRSRW